MRPGPWGTDGGMCGQSRQSSTSCPPIEAAGSPAPHGTAWAVPQRLRNDSARIRPRQPGFPDSASPAAKLRGGPIPPCHNTDITTPCQGGAGGSPCPCDLPGSTRTPSGTGDDSASSYGKALGSASSTPATLGKPCLCGARACLLRAGRGHPAGTAAGPAARHTQAPWLSSQLFFS